MRLVFVLIACFLAFFAKAQLLIDTSFSANDLVKKVLLDNNSSILIRNVSYQGSKESIAMISGMSEEFPIKEGILLSSGNVFDVLGPNSRKDAGRKTSALRDKDLQALATGVVLDAAFLEFELLSLKDSISFEYIFASEEYPEYVDKGVNDIFAFFLFELDSRAIYPQNIATLPNTRIPVSIDNVNHRVNEAFFLRSDFLDAHTDAFWNENLEMFYRASVFELDGYRTKLEAKKKLKAGRWYKLKIAIGDVGDRFYDSVVFLKAKSMQAKGKVIPDAKKAIQAHITTTTDLQIEGKGDLEYASFSLTVHFDSNEAIIKEESFEALNKLSDLLKSKIGLNVEIIGHTDNVGAESENLILSQKRALAVQNYLIEQGVDSETLTNRGVGELKPKSSNATEKGKYSNRRVEFIFSLS